MLITVFKIFVILAPICWRQRALAGDVLVLGVNKTEKSGEEKELCMVASKGFQHWYIGTFNNQLTCQ